MKTSPPIDVGMLTGHRLNSMRISEENEVKKKSKAQPRVLKWLPSLMLTLLFLAGSSWSAMGQSTTMTSTPAPVSGVVYICVDGTVTLHVDGSQIGVNYGFRQTAPDNILNETIAGNGGRISSEFDIFNSTTPPLYTIGAFASDFSFGSTINIDVTAKPTPPTLTLSQPEGSVNASINLTAIYRK